MEYKRGIDFIINVYEKRSYLRMLVDSIHKYTKDIPYTINIVNCWHGGEKGKNSSFAELNEMFGEDTAVNIIEGFDQTDTTVVQSNGSVGQDGNKLLVETDDGNKMAAGGLYTVPSIRKAMDATNQKYMCVLDADLIFLNEWVEGITALAEKYFFVSNRWDPGAIFTTSSKRAPEEGIAKNMFWFMKREHCVKNDLYPNCRYKDLGGNMTLFAQENDLPFIVLKNTYWNSTRRGLYNGCHIQWDWIKEWHVGGDVNQHIINEEHHLIDLHYGEQMYVDGVPFAFHQNRFVRNQTDKNDDWITKTTKYLEEN
jgi:hypothetical protein